MLIILQNLILKFVVNLFFRFIMAPPLYNDLGKSAKDLFNRGYNFDTFKLDLSTKTPAGVEFSSGGVSHFDSGKVLGTLETKYRFKEYGSYIICF